MARGSGWWVSPQGKVIRVADNHGAWLMERPEVIGLSDEEVDQMLEEAGERRGQEGQVRSDLISRAVQSGWIRVRYYPSRRGDYLSINVRSGGSGRHARGGSVSDGASGIDSRTADKIMSFFESLEGPKKKHRYKKDASGNPLEIGEFKEIGGPFVPVVISDDVGNKILQTTPMKILYGFSLYSNANESLRTPFVVEHVDTYDNEELVIETKQELNRLLFRSEDVHPVVEQIMKKMGIIKG